MYFLSPFGTCICFSSYKVCTYWMIMYTLKDIYNFLPSLHGLRTVKNAFNKRHCATIMHAFQVRLKFSTVAEPSSAYGSLPTVLPTPHTLPTPTPRSNLASAPASSFSLWLCLLLRLRLPLLSSSSESTVPLWTDTDEGLTDEFATFLKHDDLQKCDFALRDRLAVDFGQ
jgi:hypothetical protein